MHFLLMILDILCSFYIRSMLYQNRFSVADSVDHYLNDHQSSWNKFLPCVKVKLVCGFWSDQTHLISASTSSLLKTNDFIVVDATYFSFVSLCFLTRFMKLILLFTFKDCLPVWTHCHASGHKLNLVQVLASVWLMGKTVLESLHIQSCCIAQNKCRVSFGLTSLKTKK